MRSAAWSRPVDEIADEALATARRKALVLLGGATVALFGGSAALAGGWGSIGGGVIAVLAGATLLVVGTWSLLHVRRQRRTIDRFGWRRVEVTFREVVIGRKHLRWLVSIHDEDRDHIGTIAGTLWVDAFRSGLNRETDASMAGSLPGDVVLLVDTGTALVSVRMPRLRRSAARWRRWHDAAPSR